MHTWVVFFNILESSRETNGKNIIQYNIFQMEAHTQKNKKTQSQICEYSPNHCVSTLSHDDCDSVVQLLLDFVSC